METQGILLLIVSILLAICSFFLIRTMSSLDTNIVKTTKNETDIALLKQETTLKHERLEEKLDELKESIQDLTLVMKEFNAKN